MFEDCVETAPFRADARFASLFLKRWVTQQTGGQTCDEVSPTKTLCADRKKRQKVLR